MTFTLQVYRAHAGLLGSKPHTHWQTQQSFYSLFTCAHTHTVGIQARDNYHATYLSLIEVNSPSVWVTCGAGGVGLLTWALAVENLDWLTSSSFTCPSLVCMFTFNCNYDDTVNIIMQCFIQGLTATLILHSHNFSKGMRHQTERFVPDCIRSNLRGSKNRKKTWVGKPSNHGTPAIAQACLLSSSLPSTIISCMKPCYG